MEVSFKSPEFSVYCGRVIKTLDSEIHGVSFIDIGGLLIKKDTIVSFLSNLFKYEIQAGNYKTYTNNCDEMKVFTWKAIDTLEDIQTIKRKTFNTEIGNNFISFTDYDIYFRSYPGHIAFRIVNDYDLEYFQNRNGKYQRISESIPNGLEEATGRFEKVIGNCD